MIEEIRQVLRTTIGKILAILAVAASGFLADATDLFTNWTTVAKEDLRDRAVEIQNQLDDLRERAEAIEADQ